VTENYEMRVSYEQCGLAMTYLTYSTIRAGGDTIAVILLPFVAETEQIIEPRYSELREAES